MEKKKEESNNEKEEKEKQWQTPELTKLKTITNMRW